MSEVASNKVSKATTIWLAIWFSGLINNCGRLANMESSISVKSGGAVPPAARAGRFGPIWL